MKQYIKRLGIEVVQELDPRHDFDGIKFYSVDFRHDFKTILKNQMRNFLFFPMVIKPFARGALIGGLLGYGVGLLTRNPNAVYDGATIGAVIDTEIYLFRGAIRYFRAKSEERDDLDL